MKYRLALALIIPALLPALDDTVFEQRVRPVLDANCAPCHDAKNHNSGFTISSRDAVVSGGSRRGTAVVAGDPAASPLVRILKGEITPRMPLGKTLADGDVATIETWIRGLKPESTGAAGQWLWPYRKPVAHNPPSVARKDWVTNSIDAFVLQKLEEQKLAPAPAASRRTLARR